MAEVALTVLIESAVDLIKNYTKVISGAKGELSELQLKLNPLNVLVAKAYKEKDTKDDLCREWLKPIKEVIFDVEDTIASCVAKSESHKSKVLYKWYTCPGTYDQAEKVKSLIDRVVIIYERSQQVFVNLPEAQISDQGSPTQCQRHKKIPREKNLIPLERETDKLINDITAPTKEFKVFSIVGMAGLGKTTLAWRIYVDARIQKEFPKVFWVKVSEEFSKNEMLLSILKNSSKEDVDTSSTTESLKEKVRKSLERGKFLIIFDDVWMVDAWKVIEDIFSLPSSNNQGRVLITTRNHEVVRYASEGDPWDLRFLNESESWKLLQLEVFGNLNDCPEALTEIGKEISKRCDGLPLAIVMIGGILHDICKREREIRRRKKEWTRVSRTVSKLINDYKGENAAATSSIISLGYKSLRSGLKDCFLYLGMFPEDAEIPVWKLKHLWIAEGYIGEEQGWSLEETAENYVNDLVDKNLLMVAKTKSDGEIKTCRVHDLIRGFCIKEAENRYKEIKWSDEGAFVPKQDDIQAWRHLSIHSCVKDYFVDSSPDLKKVRSFLSFSNETFTLKKEQVPIFIDAFGVLRVLDINMAINFPEFPFRLTQLILLKYVTLSSVDFKVLPKEIYRLLNVQILQVYTSSPTLEIKANIWRMMKLRHFKTKASIILISRQKDMQSGKGGESFRTLSRLSPQNCTVEVFNKAKNLKELGIRGDLNNLSGSKFSILRELDLLEKLKLVHEQLEAASYDKKLSLPDQPTWFPKGLKILIMSGTRLEWEHMSILGQVSTLEVLKLKNNAFTGHRWKAIDNGFHNLESLHISDADLTTWALASAKTTLPNLKKLVLKNCHQLSEVPDELVKRLELLHMDGVGISAVFSALKLHDTIKQLSTVSTSSFKLVIPRLDITSLRSIAKS